MEKMRPELGVEGWSIWIGGKKGEGTSSETMAKAVGQGGRIKSVTKASGR